MTTESPEFRTFFRDVVRSRVKSRYGHAATVAEFLGEVEDEASHWAEVFETGRVKVTIKRSAQGAFVWSVVPHG